MFTFIKISLRFGLDLINRAAYFGFGSVFVYKQGQSLGTLCLYLFFLFHTTGTQRR